MICTIAWVLLLLVALQHLYIMYLECFQWTRFIRRMRPKASDEFIHQTRTFGQNQGLYNGFLAAGMVWALITSDPTLSLWLPVFFLSCVVVAGIVGGLTASKLIFYIQSLPAALALIMHFICH